MEPGEGGDPVSPVARTSCLSRSEVLGSVSLAPREAVNPRWVEGYAAYVCLTESLCCAADTGTTS